MASTPATTTTNRLKDFTVPNKIRVWDLPTRLFHWLLLAALIGLVICAQVGGSAMEWHFRFGYMVLSLLMFRFVWGLVGGLWSRFASFIYSPATVVRYLRGHGSPEHSVGHNPLGAISVFLLLGMLLLQVASGLVSDDEIAAAGPFVKYVTESVVRNATYYHKDIGATILLGMVALHLGAVLFYLIKKRQNLTHSMIYGDKEIKPNVRWSRDDAQSRAQAFAIFLGCLVLVMSIVSMTA